MRFIFIFVILFQSCSSPKVSVETTKNLEEDLLKRIEQKVSLPPDKKVETKSKIEKTLLIKEKVESFEKPIVEKPIVEKTTVEKINVEKDTILPEGNVVLSEPSNENIPTQVEENLFNGFEAEIKSTFDYNYKVSLMGMVMGELRRFSKKINEDEFLLAGTLKNNSFYKYLYSIDDSITTNVRGLDFYPILVNIVKNENKRSSVSIQKKINNQIAFFENNLHNGNKNSNERFLDYLGHYFDPLLFLRFIEVVNVEKNLDKKFPVIYTGKLYFLKINQVKEVYRSIKGKKVKVQKIFFDTIRNNIIKNDQKISIEKTIEDTPKIISLEGRMKIGILHGEIVE